MTNKKQQDRLFVPLKALWFGLFKSGRKKWELRGLGNQFNENTVCIGRRVELRRGYNGESLFGRITKFIIIESTLSAIPREIWKETVPCDEEETDVSILDFVQQYEDKYSKWILFKVDVEKENEGL